MRSKQRYSGSIGWWRWNHARAGTSSRCSTVAVCVSRSALGEAGWFGYLGFRRVPPMAAGTSFPQHGSGTRYPGRGGESAHNSDQVAGSRYLTPALLDNLALPSLLPPVADDWPATANASLGRAEHLFSFFTRPHAGAFVLSSAAIARQFNQTPTDTSFTTKILPKGRYLRKSYLKSIQASLPYTTYPRHLSIRYLPGYLVPFLL